MSQGENPLEVFLREYVSTGSPNFGKRFHYDMPSMIVGAQNGDEIAAINLLHYFKESVKLCGKTRGRVIVYLIDAINGLSLSERARLVKTLQVTAPDPDAHDILVKLPEITPKAEMRLIKKMTACMGRPSTNGDEGCERICMGAEVSTLCAQYSDRDSLHYDKTKEMGFEPLERAICDVAQKKYKSPATIRRAYHLYQKYHQWGCIDDTGRFITRDYEWLFPESE